MSRILTAFGMDDGGESQAQDQKILNALDPGQSILSSETAHATQSVERPATAAIMPPDPALPREFLPMDSDSVCVPATPARVAEEEPFSLRRMRSRVSSVYLCSPPHTCWLKSSVLTNRSW